MLHQRTVQSLCHELTRCAATTPHEAMAENRAKSLKPWGIPHEPVSRCATMSARRAGIADGESLTIPCGQLHNWMALAGLRSCGTRACNSLACTDLGFSRVG